MTNIVAARVHRLAGEFEDLKVRLRMALAGELARQFATAVGDVVRTVVAGRDIPRDSWSGSTRTEDDPWDEDDDDEYDRPASRSMDDAQPSGSGNPGLVVAASVHVARWWLLARRGHLLGALGAGFGIGLLGLLGGPVIQSALAILAAVGDLFNIGDAVGTTAERLPHA
ncbi:MAG: hypothetical protein U0791_24110 [Gemmataceae bacterium]